jgi:hypothetical protein
MYCSIVLVHFATTRRVVNGANVHCATRQSTLLTVYYLLLAACRLPHARMAAPCSDGVVRPPFRFTMLLDYTSPILTLFTVVIVGLRN